MDSQDAVNLFSRNLICSIVSPCLTFGHGRFGKGTFQKNRFTLCQRGRLREGDKSGRWWDLIGSCENQREQNKEFSNERWYERRLSKHRKVENCVIQRGIMLALLHNIDVGSTKYESCILNYEFVALFVESEHIIPTKIVL